MRTPVLLIGALLMDGPNLGTGPDLRLAGSDDLFVALQGPQARVFLSDGRPLLRLPPLRDLPGSSSPGSPDEVQERREQIFELFDVPTELRDSQEADDLVEEELTLPQRVAPGGAADGGPRAHSAALAAGDARGLWVAAGGELYRIGPGVQSARVGPLPRSLLALAAADDGTLVLATTTELLASADGGKTFRSLMRLARPPTHLAVDPSLRWLAWADAAGLHLLRGRNDRPSLPARVRDLAICGGRLVVLADDGLHVANEQGDLALVCGPLPGRQIACARAGDGPWLLVGEGLLVSVDGGRSFRPRVDGPPGLISAAAVTRDHLWVVSPTAGLTSLSIEEQPVAHAFAVSAANEERPEHLPRWAALLLPRLILSSSYAATARRRDFRTLAVAELPLGGRDPRLRQPDPAGTPRLAFAQPEAPEPLPTPPAAAYPGPLTSPYPPRDVDAACLPAVRTAAVARAQAEPERARSLVGRAGHAAWLPELRLRGEKRLGRSESLDVRPGTAAAPTIGRDALGLDVFDDVRYEVRATWDLPRLIFSPDEVAAVQQALRMADMRREIEAQVNRIYFERRRLLVNPAGGPPVEATGALLRVEELEAELDAVSGGAFSRCRGVGPPLSGP